MKASKGQVVDILKSAFKKLDALNHKAKVVSLDKICFDKDKGTDYADIDLIYTVSSLPCNNKVRLLIGFKEDTAGNFHISGNGLQCFQYLGSINDSWCRQLNSHLNANYKIYPDDQYFMSNNGSLIYVFGVKYSAYRRDNIESLVNDIGAFILDQLQYACLPIINKGSFGQDKPIPMFNDVDKI